MKEDKNILTDQAWKQMEHLLDKHMPVKKKRFLGLWWWLGISALVMLSTYLYFAMSRIDSATPNNNLESQSIYASNENLNHTQEQDIHTALDTTQLVATLNNEEVTLESFSSPQPQANNNLEKINEISIPNSNGNRNYLISNESQDANSREELSSIRESFSAQVISETLASESGSKNIKNQINKLYITDTANSEIESQDGSVDKIPENDQDRLSLASVVELPFGKSEILISLKGEEIVENRSALIPNPSKENRKWEFGIFGSYHRVDNYFKGYDIGIMAAYQKSSLGIGLKLGYDNLRNTTDQVLQGAALGVSNSTDSNLLQDSRSAGFKLNDLILEKNNLLAEFNVFYTTPWKVSLASGIGYKRLLDVSTRSISGFNPDDMSAVGFEPEADSNNVLDASLILENPSVNRNRFYVPLELGYRPIKNIQIGVGAQLFINNVFNDFEEKNKSFFGRVSIIF